MRLGFVKNISDEINNQDRELDQRLYLALSSISEPLVIIALIIDVITGEHPIEIAALIVTSIMVPLFAYIGAKKNCIPVVIRITVIAVVFMVLPLLFFFGGGLKGGGVLWIIFAFAYAGLILSGNWRRVMLVMIFLLAFAFYLLDYFYPELVNDHTSEMFHVDSYISLVFVGSICFLMTWLQNRFFREENERARKAAELAEELTRSQNRFFSSMSHEIRTPINSILGLNELILRDKNTTDEVVRDAVGIQGSGKMLLALINDILDFSKMEAGNMEIIPVDYNVGSMLSEIVNMIWIRAEEKGLEFNVHVDPKVPSSLYGDEIRIKQVIINLLNNAVKYTADGSIELSVESERKADDKTELSISVTDTGIGITKESIPYLFDAFKRVDEERNRHIEGTGLGLSIVKQLVELMGGTITVNSVYGEGTTFTVVLLQGIADETEIGNLNVINQTAAGRTRYECSFRAPEARILIVDDNEMNLDVESKLLVDTEMTIDNALSGKEALELALRNRYDVILMDHLMPEMDGIECMERLRAQVGGLNRTTPVVVLTANAGSSNRELYNRAGFDGYMVKPISGEALEAALMKHISKDKLNVNSNKMMNNTAGINTSEGYSGKTSVIITSTSMCDLPDRVIRKLNIPILPFKIKTGEGVFKDGVQIGSDEMIRYLNDGRDAESAPPDESEYTAFFAAGLKRAHHLIHIAITSSMSEDYKIASEAAKSFDNVTVINSACISSATGILVLIAHKLAQMNLTVEEIVNELESVKKRMNCSFIIDTTTFMAKKGLVSRKFDRLTKGLNLHVCLKMKNDKSGIGGLWMGDRNRTYKKYIDKALSEDSRPDPEIAFITYVDVPVDTLMWIEDEIKKRAAFENVVFKQASAAISTNCGPGAFGILYFDKSDKSYNLSPYVYSEVLSAADDEETEVISSLSYAEVDSIETGMEAFDYTEDRHTEWYDRIEGIDGSIALQNSGSESAFKSVLRIFYDSIESKSEELEGFYASENWKDYNIKVHALKSSAKLIGAMGFSRKAKLLEDASREGDAAYIREHHADFMKEFLAYKEKLGELCADETVEGPPDRPIADRFLMESVYDGLLSAAEEMDCDAMEDIMKEISGYAIPEEDRQKFDRLNAAVESFDYDEVMNIIKND